MAMSTFAVAAASSSSPAGVAASSTGVAGFLWRFRVEGVSDSVALKLASIAAVFLVGGVSLIYNASAVYNAFSTLEVAQGLFRLYMFLLTVFLMAVEMEFSAATIAWHVLIETRAGRGFMYLLLSITLRELPDLFGATHGVANSALLLAIFFIAAGLFVLCSASASASGSGSGYAATISLRNDAVLDAQRALYIEA